MRPPGLAALTTLVLAPPVGVAAWAGPAGALVIAPIALLCLARRFRAHEAALGGALASRRIRWAPVWLTLVLQSAAIGVNVLVLVAAGRGGARPVPR